LTGKCDLLAEQKSKALVVQQQQQREYRLELSAICTSSHAVDLVVNTCTHWFCDTDELCVLQFIGLPVKLGCLQISGQDVVIV